MKLFRKFPTRRQILFRAGKEPHENADEIVRYLNEDFEGKKYRIVYLDDEEEKTAGNEVIHLCLCTIRFKTTVLKLVKYCFIYACTRYLCYENEVIEKISSKQTLIYLNHGTIPLKNVSDVLRQPDTVDLATCPGPGCVELYESQYHIPREKLIFMMPARVNRMLSGQAMPLHWKTENTRKIILWLPTFRQLVGTQRKDSNVIDPIQLFTENREEINEILERNGELLLIKKHPREKEQLVSHPELKNIVVIEDKDITDQGNSLQDLLKTADALLTDYSGIAFEYMLLDRPVVTLRNTTPGPHILNVESVDEVEGALEKALQRPDELMHEMRKYVAFHESHLDGNNAANILNAVDDFIENRQKKLRHKPLNLFRRLKVRWHFIL